MKKRLLLGVAGLLLVGTIVPAAFALSDNQNDQLANVNQVPATEANILVEQETAQTPTPAPVENYNAPGNVDNQWFNQMFDWHDSWVDAAEKNGQVTPEQADAWQDHFNYMREFHGENGFGMMGGMMGGYAPGANGNSGYGMGGGYGMMGGYYPQEQ